MAKLTISDAARVAGVARSTLHRAIRAGRLSVDPDGHIDTAELLRACSGREGLNLTGESPVVPIARFRHVAIPQFVVGNHTFFAWRTRPGCPEDFALLR